MVRRNGTDIMALTGHGLVDAATAHAAGRYFDSYTATTHREPNGERAGYDRLLFVDLLHQLLLYEQLTVVSSRDNNHRDVDNILAILNERAGKEVLLLALPDWDGEYKTEHENLLIENVCRLIRGLATDSFSAEIKRLHIPGLYNGPVHEDYGRFSSAATRVGLDRELIPFGLYCFRGICYAGMGRSISSQTGRPTIYTAAPGRLTALEKILSAEALRQFRFPGQEYADLLKILNLPTSGYDFTFVDMPVSQLSQVAAIAQSKAPGEALEWIAGQRERDEGVRLRLEWSAKLATSGAATGLAEIRTSDNARATASYLARLGREVTYPSDTAVVVEQA
jgi:hypothetical protein